MKKFRILWIDDEIELFKAHILFLTEKGYLVETVSNGEDGINEVIENSYDLVFLDEMMPGMGGLETLDKIKSIDKNIPVVMVTKSEEETLMHDAIGSKIDDYLIKPVLPSQILLICKKFLESKRISEEYVSREYLQDYNEINRKLLEPNDFNEWIEIYRKLVNWDLESDLHPDLNIKQMLNEQFKECNKEFSKFVERKYSYWVKNAGSKEVPLFSTDIVQKYLPNLLNTEGPVFFFVVDCLRLDQWLVMEEKLKDIYNIKKDFYYSILPTATAYSRNALFSGLFPSEIEKYFKDFWKNGDDEKGINDYEKDLLDFQLKRMKTSLKTDLKYIKIIDPEFGRNFEQNVSSYKNSHLTAVVINFLDMIAHGRSDSTLLKEIAPDEPAYRSLTNSWFSHSSLLGTFKKIASIPNSKILLTTDHGSLRCLRGAKVLGDKEASHNLRFKYGRNLKADSKQAVFVKNPEDYKLPNLGVTVNYIIAKEDYYFIYPTEYHKYLTQYKDTFLHGGISMEEVILPVVVMESK